MTKVNGELHWFCSSHRDRQNALKRARYKRVVRNKNRKARSSSPAPANSHKKRANRTAPSVGRRSQAHTNFAGAEEKVTTPETLTETLIQYTMLHEDGSSCGSATQVASIPGASQVASTSPEHRCSCSTNNTIREPSGTPMVCVPGQVTNTSATEVAYYPVQDQTPIYALLGQQLVYVLMQAVQVPQAPRYQAQQTARVGLQAARDVIQDWLGLTMQCFSRGGFKASSSLFLYRQCAVLSLRLRSQF
ncbi:hypothetical protein PR003_g19872 [Phytophthora rubi]|uniref:Uncharacterized protein n=1 Tax=Phytophthora rubi TaxID=129364 RepID=A0A6A3JP57_9STRA|nr:hypothetical protein PR002_g20075 [Phytophthora rubi]KAE8997029.1 hypothetical protein PR001_g19698 [Phytophthora rubi]KAE9312002.1 hypothetical protein PR003_g19872 [Phytophthora rubi]